jgi:hypothetical protein
MRFFLILVCALLALSHAVGQKRKVNADERANEVHNTAAPQSNGSQQAAFQPNSNEEPGHKKNGANPETDKRFFSSPEWISAFSAVAIVVLTLGYVFVSGGMLWQMRRQAKVAYQQWIVFENWRVAKVGFDDSTQSGIADIFFEVANPTAFPLTLRSVKVKIANGESFSESPNYRLVPKGSKSFSVRAALDNATPNGQGGVSFTPTIAVVTVRVEYKSVLGVGGDESVAMCCTLMTDSHAFTPFEVSLPKQT